MTHIYLSPSYPCRNACPCSRSAWASRSTTLGWFTQTGKRESGRNDVWLQL